jgi:intein/homing endonuclease
MPVKEVAYKSALTGEVTSFIEKLRTKSGGQDGDVEFLSVIDFIEKFKLLPYGLYPVQKFIVKLYYNIPLDDTKKTIKISDKFNAKSLYEFTEVEYLKYLHSQGRCNISEQDGRHRRELILCIGRRSGKSALSAIFAAYELYKLLRRGNPQAFYGMPGGSEIRVLCVANDKEQASIVYGDMQSHIESVDYFKNSIANTTQTYIKFRTENDRQRYGDGGKASIAATFKSSIAKGLRGRGVICAILDEIAFFVDDGRCISLDSYILTDSGPQKLGDILNNLDVDRSVTGWTDTHLGIIKENGEMGTATAVYYGGIQSVRNITTKCGYSITGTHEHRLKVMNTSGYISWKYLSDIEIGDYIGINRKTNLWAESYYDVSRISELARSCNRYHEYDASARRLGDWLSSLSTSVIITRSSLANYLGISKKVFDKLMLRASKLKCKNWHGIIDPETRRLSVRWYPNDLPESFYYHNELNSVNLPDELDENYGELLGILVGDGTWNKKNAIQVTGGCEEFREYIQAKFTYLFGKQSLYRRWNEKTTCEVSPYDITVNSKILRDFLYRCGYDHSKPREKHTPWIIFRSPKSVVSKYLSGLFETDGGLEQNGRTISFCTVSRQLAVETQILLLNFGITCSLYTKKYSKDSTKYTLRIIGADSRSIFASEIGFITARKKCLLDEGLTKLRDASNTIPYQLGRLKRILNLIPSNPGRHDSGDLRTKFTRLTSSQFRKNHESDLSYSNARKIVNLLGKGHSSELSDLSYICDTNYFWDPVIGINESKEEVADLRVPEGEQYVAQGMTNHNSGAERIYSAITPSLAQFSPRDPNDKLKPVGPSEGRMILISSPDAKEGFFYRLFQQAMANGKGASDMLVIQAPTWEVNPTLDSSYYEKEYYKNPNAFMTEHGAEFSDRVRGWIEDSRDLFECIDDNLKPVNRGIPREVHFAGIDVGLVNDGTSIAITRINNGKIELVYHEVWYAKKRWKECNPHLTEPLTPYAHTLQDQIRLDMSEIALWFKAVSQRFYIHKAIFDQWSGIVFEQELHKNGLKQFEIRNMFTSDSSHMYQTFKMFMYNRQLSLYNYPKPESEIGISSGRHSPLITELLELQATSGGKNIISVEAPNAPGKHDDMADALARSILLASEYIKENPGVLDKRTFARQTEHLPARTPTYHQYHRMRAQMHGASGIRTAPRIKKR